MSLKIVELDVLVSTPGLCDDDYIENYVKDNFRDIKIGGLPTALVCVYAKEAEDRDIEDMQGDTDSVHAILRNDATPKKEPILVVNANAKPKARPSLICFQTFMCVDDQGRHYQAALSVPKYIEIPVGDDPGLGTRVVSLLEAMNDDDVRLECEVSVIRQIETVQKKLAHLQNLRLVLDKGIPLNPNRLKSQWRDDEYPMAIDT